MVNVRLQDDFYEAVNGKWAEAAVIPDDKPLTGGFMDLDEGIEKWGLALTDQWLSGENLPSDTILQNFVKYHRLIADDDTREKLGVAPALSLIEEMKTLASFKDYATKLAAFEKQGKSNLLPFYIAPDFMDAQTNVLWATGLSTILPDTTYYAPDHEQGPELLKKWREAEVAYLEKFGFTESDISDLLDKVMSMDREIAKHVLSNEEGAKYTENYHPYQFDDFAKLVPELPLADFFTEMLGQVPDKVIVQDKRFWEEGASHIYTKENWENIKANLIHSAVHAYSSYLTDEIRILSGVYSRALSGTPQAISKKKAAYRLASSAYSQALGLYYANEKFSPEAKTDVEGKVATMIDVYKSRLKNADWLQAETREKAIIKLDTITPFIAYPDKLPARYEQKVIDESKTLIENVDDLASIEIAYQWSKWNQPVDKTEWHMPAHMVNAYYDPQQNNIVFPAAILQAPFYSLGQSSSANYGGIGAVIAHEISHAFDTNGASFDEHGSLKDWWTKEDYEVFKARTQKVVDQFEGQDSYGAKVNGQLTVSENVADLGGVAAALEAAKRDQDFSAEEFFLNFARIWRMKARLEYMQMLAAVDVHAPGKLRTNVTLPNFDDFHETFGIQEGDGMWREPDERVIIW